VLDAIYFEELGLPAAAILTEPFHSTGVAIAELRGFAAYPFAQVAHPVTSLNGEQVIALADSVTPIVEQLLLSAVAENQASPTRSAPTLDDVAEILAMGLRSDGADLTATEVDGRIVFDLSIPTEACAECVMPSTMLTSIFQNVVDTELGPGHVIVLNDPRE
jgi:hypothetical protein